APRADTCRRSVFVVLLQAEKGQGDAVDGRGTLSNGEGAYCAQFPLHTILDASGQGKLDAVTTSEHPAGEHARDSARRLVRIGERTIKRDQQRDLPRCVDFAGIEGFGARAVV